MKFVLFMIILMLFSSISLSLSLCRQLLSQRIKWKKKDDKKKQKKKISVQKRKQVNKLSTEDFADLKDLTDHNQLLKKQKKRKGMFDPFASR